jgi:hypothetical protein
MGNMLLDNGFGKAERGSRICHASMSDIAVQNFFVEVYNYRVSRGLLTALISFFMT